MSKSVADIVTERIIAKLMDGDIPWIRPYTVQAPINWVTQKPYTGINMWLLDSGEYLTYAQIQANKGKLKSGSKAHLVIYYKEIEPKKNSTRSAKTQDDTKERTKKILRYYTVYSVDDCFGIQPHRQRGSGNTVISTEIKTENLDNLIKQYLRREKITVNRGSGKCCYSIVYDTINIPNKEDFTDIGFYYSTLLHEVAHSTGAENRLKRTGFDLTQGNRSQYDYAYEEIVAECTAAQICAVNGIDTTRYITNMSAYIQSWLRVLSNDVSLVLAAAAKAEKAVKYIQTGEK